MKFIINADDFGKTHSINLAVAECFKKGYISNTSIMVNMPFTDEAVEIAKRGGFFDCVGLHVNLTEGNVLSSDIVDTRLMKNGVLTGRFDLTTQGRMFQTKQVREQMYSEIENQIKKYLDFGFSELHMDSHRHVHTGLAVYPEYKFLFKKYGFKSMRLSRNMAIDGTTKAIIKFYKHLLNKDIRRCSLYTSDLFGGFIDLANYVKNGNMDNRVVEIMCHPDFDENGRLLNLYAGNGEEEDLVGFFYKYIHGGEMIAYSGLT